jgi:hypothetical protein
MEAINDRPVTMSNELGAGSGVPGQLWKLESIEATA